LFGYGSRWNLESLVLTLLSLWSVGYSISNKL
jgi:hypothetical protein